MAHSLSDVNEYGQIQENIHVHFRRGESAMPYDCKIIGIVIREIRREKGISQEVLSGLADIGRSHLAMIEKGIKNPNVDTLWKIAKAMDLPLSGLFQKYEKAAGERIFPAGNENLR